MRKFILAALAAARGNGLQAVDSNWKAAVNGVYNDDANWSLGAPQTGTNGHFNVAGDYTVTFPAGGYTDYGATVVDSTGGGTMRFDTTGTWWLKGAGPAWGNPTFKLGGDAHSFNIENTSSRAQMMLSNGVFAAMVSGTGKTNTLESGLLNLYDPDGIVSSNTLIACGWDTAHALALVINEGAELRAYNLDYRAKGTENAIIMNGGRFDVYGDTKLCSASGTSTEALFDLRGGEFVSHGAAYLGFMSDRKARMNIGTGAQWTALGLLDVGSRSVARASGELNIDGGSLVANSLIVGYYTAATGIVSLIDGSLLTTNFTICNNTTAFADVSVSGGTWTSLVSSVVGADGVGRVAVSGGDLYWKGVRLGANSSATSRVEVTGGSLQCVGNGEIGYRGFGEIDVSGGFFSWTGGWIMIGAFNTGAETSRLRISGGETVFNTVSPGFYSGAGEILISGGSNCFYQVNLGQSDSAPCVRSVFHVEGGTNYIKNGLTIGNKGVGNAEILGGFNTISTVTMGYASNKASQVSTLLVSGGETVINGALTVAYNAKHSAILSLNGGRITVANIIGGTGDSALQANGGTVAARQNHSTFINNIAAAALGADGLTIDTAGYAITVPQAFSNQADAAGRLVKVGTGTLTLTGANTHSETAVAGGSLLLAASGNPGSNVLVTNAAVLALASGVTSGSLESLTLGDAETFGTLALTNGQSLVITRAGGLSVPFGRIRLDGAWADGTYTLMTCAGTVAASALESLEVANGSTAKAYTIAPVASGESTIIQLTIGDPVAPAEKVWSGTTGDAWGTADNWTGTAVPVSGDRAVFPDSATTKSVTVAAGAVAGGLDFTSAASYTLTGSTLTLDNAGQFAELLATAGSHTVNAPVASGHTLNATLSDGAAVTLAGTVSGTGGLNKYGSGTLVLGAANTFKGGVTLNGGRLALNNPDALGSSVPAAESLALTSGTLRYQGAADAVINRGFTVAGGASTAAVVIDAATNVTFAGAMGVASGAIVKRGAGALILAPDGSTTLSAGSGNQAFTATLDFPANGDSPTNGFGGFTVAEGPVVIRTNPGETTRIPNSIAIGAQNAQGLVSPSLTFDGGNVFCDSGDRIYLGSATPAGSVMTNPVLRLVNGASVAAASVELGTWNPKQETCPEVSLDNSTLTLSWIFKQQGTGAGCASRISIRNGSLLKFTGNQYLAYEGTFDIEVDNSRYEVTPSNCGLFVGNGGSGLLHVFNGGVISLPVITVQSAKAAGVTLAFDSGTLHVPCDGALLFWNTELQHVTAQAGGLIVDVGADLTYRVCQPIEGEGGLNKIGAGRLVLDQVYELGSGTTTNYVGGATGLYAGHTVVEEGTLAVSNGTIAATSFVDVEAGATLDLSAGNVALGTLVGAGTVTNGTLGGKLAWVDGAMLTLSDVATTNTFTVDFGRADDNPFPKGTSVEVVKLAGTVKPDVTKWASTGAGEGYQAVFTVKDDTVYATFQYENGSRVILR